MVVRSKVDMAVEAGQYDHGWSQEETLAHLERTLSLQTGIEDPSRISLTTTRKHYWAGQHGGQKFGSIDDLCKKVAERITAAMGTAGNC
eukprot:6608913-Prorocentrum_lima.AAC.1